MSRIDNQYAYDTLEDRLIQICYFHKNKARKFSLIAEEDKIRSVQDEANRRMVTHANMYLDLKNILEENGINLPDSL